MGNIRNDLKRLFKDSLINKSNNVIIIRDNRNINDGSHCNEIVFPSSVRIYFYEWSDIYRVPRTFDDMSSFEDYLKACGLYLQIYQRDIICNCGTAFVCCYKGSKELNVRGSYAKLQDSMLEHDRLSKELEESRDKISKPIDRKNPFYGSEGASKIQSPSLILEPNGRWDDDYCSERWY